MLVTKQVALRRITSVLNKGASFLKRADKKFTRSLVLDEKGGDARDIMYEASAIIEEWLTEVAKVVTEVFGNELISDSYVDSEVGGHDIYGNMTCVATNESSSGMIFISYDMDWNDMYHHDISLDFSNPKGKSFMWEAGVFNKQKYKKYVAACMIEFSKNGFGGPGSPSFVKSGR